MIKNVHHSIGLMHFKGEEMSLRVTSSQFGARDFLEGFTVNFELPPAANALMTLLRSYTRPYNCGAFVYRDSGSIRYNGDKLHANNVYGLQVWWQPQPGSPSAMPFLEHVGIIGVSNDHIFTIAVMHVDAATELDFTEYGEDGGSFDVAHGMAALLIEALRTAEFSTT
jgi:hypothetical protein